MARVVVSHTHTCHQPMVIGGIEATGIYLDEYCDIPSNQVESVVNATKRSMQQSSCSTKGCTIKVDGKPV